MSDKPLVSVVIPTYNRPIFLVRCIESVLNQTYDQIEVFVVDDNNPNTEARIETEKVMQQFANDHRVTYLQHEKNKNGSAARNTGWRQSKGQYITFLDDDDVIENTKIEKQVKCLECLDSSWVACYTGYRLIKENGNAQISSEKKSGDCYVDALMRTMFMGSGSNLFVRKSVVDEIDGYDESFKRNQDIEFLVRVLEKGKLAHIDEVLLTIYQEGVRVSNTFEEIESYTKHYIEKFERNISNLDEEECKRVMSVISLERFRVACYKRKFGAGIKILITNHVSIKYIFLYFKYILRRMYTHESYGFNGR